ncbi:uncharacterized protein STEHIDRAFT_155957 [Stereum hirsutum FP-91666 SS1]|uniref:uncharacterized protein n=1 Tax=Stereum hirsutum (strain FP-91666) TaxID=721885 RepID=UPI000440D2A7|nr:uncharacterized protein STEHIDRAFT_155957 [Stereum hirsutum FP-91666 SS1]EIM88604.1 hypothetical protein STEHIDRAFT_155957 [Stereum hirsutum FP-91666 SS1]
MHTVEYGVSFLPVSSSTAKQASDPDFSPPTAVQPAAIESPVKVIEVLETKLQDSVKGDPVKATPIKSLETKNPQIIRFLPTEELPRTYADSASLAAKYPEYAKAILALPLPSFVPSTPLPDNRCNTDKPNTSFGQQSPFQTPAKQSTPSRDQPRHLTLKSIGPSSRFRRDDGHDKENAYTPQWRANSNDNAGYSFVTSPGVGQGRFTETRGRTRTRGIRGASFRTQRSRATSPRQSGPFHHTARTFGSELVDKLEKEGSGPARIERSQPVGGGLVPIQTSNIPSLFNGVAVDVSQSKGASKSREDSVPNLDLVTTGAGDSVDTDEPEPLFFDPPSSPPSPPSAATVQTIGFATTDFSQPSQPQPESCGPINSSPPTITISTSSSSLDLNHERLLPSSGTEYSFETKFALSSPEPPSEDILRSNTLEYFQRRKKDRHTDAAVWEEKVLPDSSVEIESSGGKESATSSVCQIEKEVVLTSLETPFDHPKSSQGYHVKSLPSPFSPASPPTTPSPPSTLPGSVLNFLPAPVFHISSAVVETSPTPRIDGAFPVQPDSGCNNVSSQQPTSQLRVDINEASRSSDQDQDPFVASTTPILHAAQPTNDQTPSGPRLLSPRHLTTISTPSRPNAQASAISASRVGRKSPRIALVEREMAQGPALVWRRAAIGLRMQAGLESPTLPHSPRRSSANIRTSPSPSPSPEACSDVEAKDPMLGFEDDFMPSPLPLSSKDAILSPPQAMAVQGNDGQKSSDCGAIGRDSCDEDPFTVGKKDRMDAVQFDSKLQNDIEDWCGATEGVLVWRFYDDLGRTTTMLQTPTRGSATA